MESLHQVQCYDPIFIQIPQSEEFHFLFAFLERIWGFLTFLKDFTVFSWAYIKIIIDPKKVKFYLFC